MSRDPHEFSALGKRPRVCLIDSRTDGPAYDRLDECNIDVMAVLPRLNEVNLPLLGNFDLVIIGCSESLLMNPAFQGRLTKIAQHARLMGVAANPSGEAAAQAARIGLHGFVAREVSPAAFDRSIEAVLNGELAFPRSAMSAVIRLIRRAYRRLPKFEQDIELTPRQKQVVDLIAQGANDREIADALRISPSTVHKHVQNALKRTKMRTRSHLAAALGQPG
ncbi:MAG: response regulator transcription factor [Chloroflexota bacterium]|nr:response regulator transcription factor [Chloroflexota bacterium]